MEDAYTFGAMVYDLARIIFIIVLVVGIARMFFNGDLF